MYPHYNVLVAVTGKTIATMALKAGAAEFATVATTRSRPPGPDGAGAMTLPLYVIRTLLRTLDVMRRTASRHPAIGTSWCRGWRCWR